MNKLITGKIFISKKSGPGEITGITEITLDDRDNVGVTGATFTDLQFTDPGDYILNISHSSNDLDPIELYIKVLPEDEIIPQVENKNNNNKEELQIDGNRPIISQIDSPSIVLPPIKMKYDSSGPGAQSQFTQGLGYTPVIWYNAFAIEDRSLKKMRLYHDGLLPKIEFTFEDTKDIMKSSVTPTDDGSIDLFLNSTSSNLKSLHMSFKMESFIQGREEIGRKYTVVGTINIPELYVSSNKTYNETSFTALRNISKEMGLGFNSNITDTDDKMSWRCTFKKPYEFMSDIISHSYISDESYMIGYIDYYYCFNYVDIEKEYNRDITKDVGIDTSGLSEQSSKSEDRIIPLKLTTDSSTRSTSNFIEKIIKINDSTKKSLKDGYSTVTKTYDRINKQFLVFSVDSTTTDGSSTVILKGARNDNKYKDENVKHQFTGKLDQDNVYKNYNYSYIQNKINLDNLNKIAINVMLPNVNWNLYKFQKIEVQIINQSETIVNPDLVDWRYSGSYIIADIEYYWNGYNMSQKLRLVRKELNKTPDEIKNEPVANQKNEIKTKNDNPIILDNTSPNLEYNIDQTYFLKNDTEIYEISIKTLIDNGIELTGELIPRFQNSTIKQGVYTFNVQSKNIFSFTESVFNKVNLVVIPYNEVDDAYISENLENIDFIDDEYIENSFQGTEEDLIEFEVVEGFPIVDVDLVNDIKEYNPDNPDSSLSTDTTSKYTISKDKDSNIKQIIKVAKNMGITNKFTITAILAIVSKESAFVPRSEASYSKTSSSKIIQIFGSKGYSENEWDVIKKDPVRFFNIIYGNRYGNGSNDGYKYRGRGFNQITFKSTYKKYGDKINVDLVSDPDLLNTVEVAAKCLIQFFKDSIKNAPYNIKNQYHFTDINSFTKLEDAVGAIYHANAGFGKSYNRIVQDSTGGRSKSFKNSIPLYNTYQNQMI